MATFQLAYINHRGYYQEQSSSGLALAKKLETLHCDAELWTIGDDGQRVEKIGGVEPSDGRTDDKRVKWIWWYDRTEVMA